ncbi:MAG TPA: UbiA family prenyltransferase [Candidatus Eisenbacteria bacterium]
MRALAPVRLVRPFNLLALTLAVGAGARLSGGDPSTPALFVPVLTAAFGYARNDAVDAAADLVNRPGRPVPSGAVGPRGAFAISWAALAAAAALLAATGPNATRVLLFAAGAAALFAYSPWGKTWGVASPLLIALLSGLAVVWGGTLGGRPERSLAAALLAALLTFSRECAKDLEDEPGDRVAGRATWPVRSGRRGPERAMRAASWLSIAALPLPWLLGDAGPLYAIAAAALVAPLLAVAGAVRAGDPPRARRLARALKLALVLGVASLWLGTA